MGTQRPLDAGRADSLGRRIRIAADAGANRADAPPPVADTSRDDTERAIRQQLKSNDRWKYPQRSMQFRLTRLIDRVFTHATHPTMLKGGMRRLAISPMARFTTDADAFVNADLDDAIDDIIRSVESPLGDDMLEYRHVETRRYGHHPSAELFFEVTFNGTPAGRASIDVSTNVRCTQPATDIPSAKIVDVPLDGPATWPSYATCDQVADKVAAIYERHPTTGGPSNRFHDLVDIELAAMTEPVDASELRDALSVEFEARGLSFPKSFTVPDRGSWTSGYRRKISDVPELRRQRLSDALDRMSAYLDPVLSDPSFEGRWDPAAGQWASPVAASG